MNSLSLNDGTSITFENERLSKPLAPHVHSARMQQTPASTVQQMHNEALPLESERLSEQA
jgi:hypothetical protein